MGIRVNVHACGWRSKDNLRCYSSDTFKSGWNQSLTGLEVTPSDPSVFASKGLGTQACATGSGCPSFFDDTCLCVGIHTRAGTHRKGCSSVRAVCSLNHWHISPALLAFINEDSGYHAHKRSTLLRNIASHLWYYCCNCSGGPPASQAMLTLTNVAAVWRPYSPSILGFSIFQDTIALKWGQLITVMTSKDTSKGKSHMPFTLNQKLTGKA